MIDFQFAKILGYNHQHDFLGESFRFASKKDITVNGSIYNLTNTSGVSGIWSGISGMSHSATDYDGILLAGVNFGPGRINSISFQEGEDVRQKNYTVSLTIYDTGNLFNATGQYYSGIDFNNTGYPMHLLESFAETFDFNVHEDLKYSYKQNVSARFASGAANGTNGNPINMARLFASGLLFSTPSFGFIDQQHSGFYNYPNGRRTYSENYNLITNECSFAESFELAPPSGNYSFIYHHDVNTDENGVTTVTEAGEIAGLVSDYSVSAEAGYATEIANAFTRCSEVFSHYLGSAPYALINTHISLSKRINKISGEIFYSIVFTNNPNTYSTYTWEYTQEISRHTEDCFYDVKENGRVRGISDCSGRDYYLRADTAYTTIKAGVSSRLQSFYDLATSLSNPLKLISGGEKRSPYVGEITYEYTYTDDLYMGVDGFKKIDYTVEDKNPVAYINKFNVINVKEIVQPTPIARDGTRTLSLKLTGERGSPLLQYLNKAQTIANSLIPSQTDVFISACSYTFSPTENAFTFNLSWTFFGEWQFSNVLL